jgi:hypothetical protein
MVRMKWFVVAVLLLCGCGPVRAADFMFDGAGYAFGWEGKEGSGSIKEYFTGDEKPETWQTLITVTRHPEAVKLADVTGPYFEARKAIVAMPPKAHRTPGSEGATDVVVELFLGAPGRTPHLEYVLARFIATDPGVHSIVYSRKFPFTGNGDQNVDVDVAIKNSARWIRELQNVPVESVRRCFLPAAGEPARPSQGAP